MELSRAFEYLDPEIRRRVKACMLVCAFTDTVELERIGKMDAEKRKAAVAALSYEKEAK